jgi:hypothetical protein
MFCSCKKKQKVIHFYKQTKESLLNQLILYLNEKYDASGNIYNNYRNGEYEYYLYEDKNLYLNLTIKCQIVENKLNCKMSIYDIITDF